MVRLVRVPMRFLRAVSVFTVTPWCAVFLGACSSGQAAPPPVLNEVPAVESLVPAPSTPDLRVPPGYDIRKFAALEGPRVILPMRDGSMFVSLTGADQVVKLTDADGDGVAEVTPALRNLDSPHGLALRDGYLYIANTGAVVRAKLGVDGLPDRSVERLAT
jgi:glucose/arabinose dehydrogenase